MPVTFWARTDSNSANNPNLNFTGDPSVEITFVPSGTDGDVILEGGGIADPDTLVEIDGATYSFTFEFSGSTPTASNQGGNQYPAELRDQQVILITVFDYPAPGETTRLAFLPEADATQLQMDSIGNGANRPQGIDETGPGVICFAAGTLLHTPEGERTVEDLQVGDFVTTLDDGPLPIIWIASTKCTWPARTMPSYRSVLPAAPSSRGARRATSSSPPNTGCFCSAISGTPAYLRRRKA